MIKFLEGTGSLVNRAAKPCSNGSGSGSLVLGRADNLYQPKWREDIYVSVRERLRHLYILGATGSGKTKLLEYLIRQDVMNGSGFGLFDPHGDLCQIILSFLGSILSRRCSHQVTKYVREKLVLIEPFNERWTVGFNPLEAKGIDPYMLASEFIGIFKKLWPNASVGSRTEELLRNTLITLTIEGLTLLEAKALLTDSAFRDKLVRNLPPGEVKEYWVFRYGRLSEKMQATYREPILNRLSVFLSSPSIRSIVGQTNSTIDFRQIIDERKWLLANLSKGKMKGNAYLLGGLLIAKLQLAALSRVDLPEEKRTPFYLVVDEFQNFVGEDFETILSEARKYGLGLVLAHQNIDQLNRQLRSAILGNVATQVFFRLSSQDATSLSSELSQKEKPMIQRRLIDLKVREAYLKRKGERPRIMKTVFVPDPRGSSEAIENVKSLSFSRYGRLRTEVEKEIIKRAGVISRMGQGVTPKTIPRDPYKGRFAPKGKFEEADEW